MQSGPSTLWPVAASNRETQTALGRPSASAVSRLPRRWLGQGFPQASQGMKTAFRQLPRQSFRKSKMLYELVLMTGTSLIFRRFNTHRSKEKVLKNSVNFL